MCCSKSPPYILLELPDIKESINYPIKNFQRIKYTCFDVSKNLIAFGATSGGIYVFNRNPCEFVQLIPNKDGAITRLSISANEKHIGFANGRGIITVTECDQSLSGGHSTISSKDHQGNEVTAMLWGDRDMLFSGDDIGKISVLQMQNFIAKTFQSSSQIIMSLDSRICQIDVRSCMLLVSTLTRCYVCDTTQEQYRQIGQKLRDGEFGACFMDKENSEQVPSSEHEHEITELKKYNMVNGDLKFAVGKDLENTLIFCARPSSRLWEATVEGTVKRTHQFKKVLGRNPLQIIYADSYTNNSFSIDNNCINNDKEDSLEGKSINFSKIYSMNSAIFFPGKDALYFLNIDNVDNTVWFEYKNMMDCKVYRDTIYVWLRNGSLMPLRFMKIDKFLLKCYIDEKYANCIDICRMYSEYLISNELSPKLHILLGLKDKIDDKELLSDINNILEKFGSLKARFMEKKSGIYVVDNTYHAQTSLDEENDILKQNNDYKFTSLHPEAMQTLKDLSVTVSGKLNTSKKILKEKWEDFEDKMKHLGDKPPMPEAINKDYIINKGIVINLPKNTSYEDESKEQPAIAEDIIYKESSQKVIKVDKIEIDKVSKSLYQCFRLSLVNKDLEKANLFSIIESNACDIEEFYNLMLKLEQYCLSIDAVDESKFAPSNIFLSYLNDASKKKEYLDAIINNEDLYKYFVDSCIFVNIKTQKLANSGCECGFPLPYTRTNQAPVFSELIDEFIEMQWERQTREQCYDTCKRMPYLWRKILYLRRNEDLMNILKILLQILDESILHSFLPQFTFDTWNKAVQLYATLYANICLNCSKKFENISVKDTLSWDELGVLMIKSVGGKNAIKIMEKHASLIDSGALSVRFYHTCLIVTMFEKFDASLTGELTDALYSSYDCEDSKNEICKLLRSTVNGQIKNTALPLAVAAKSTHWGLKLNSENNEATNVSEIVENVLISNNVTDCALCGLPLQNAVLIQDGGLWVFSCGHTFHGACLDLNKIRLCPSCSPVK